MTKVNDYLWLTPHEPEFDDPPDIDLLQKNFNLPLVETVQGPLVEIGYDLKSSDILINMDSRLDQSLLDQSLDTYYANVRFLKYLRPDVLARIHFEHREWAHFLPQQATHEYTITLDRFLIADPATQQIVPDWEGRIHTGVSNLDADVLETSGADQLWVFNSKPQFERQLALFLDKFLRLGIVWLENSGSM
jgi:hypothetical protein